MFELLKIPYIQNKAIQTLIGTKSSKGKAVNTLEHFYDSTNKVNSQKQSQVTDEFIGKKSNSSTPPFLLTFEIFNNNVSNCMVDSRASSNVMPYSVGRKMNAEIQKYETRIIQLDRSNVSFR